MAEIIDVDPASVLESAQKSMQSTVDGGAPGAVPLGGMSSLLDAAAFGFTTLLGARSGTASGVVVPRGPVRFGQAAAGLGLMTATEAANATQTASVQAPPV